MPKGAKKRAKLKKKQQQGHADDGGNNAHHNNGNASGSGSDQNNGTASGRRNHHLRISPKDSHVDASEDSMESSEEMVTPRAGGSEVDEEERKAAPDVPVERADQVMVEKGDAEEEVMVDALPPESSGQASQGKDDAEVEVQEPEVKDVVVSEAPPVQELEVKDVVVSDARPVQESEAADAPVVEVPEVKREAAKVHPVHEPEPTVDELVHPVHESEPKVDELVVAEETPAPPVVQEPEVKGGSVVVKDSSEVSRSQEVDVQTTETARGPAVAVAASGQWTTWWNCCGLFDAFSGSER